MHVQRIWDHAPHNAFTDLVRFSGVWWCCFREAESHNSRDGAVRVIRSDDGDRWESAALLTGKRTEDLRDPKLTVTPTDELMLTAAGVSGREPDMKLQSFAWFSNDGSEWGKREDLGHPDYWLWRVVWHGAAAYSMAYGTFSVGEGLRLYRSIDGRYFEVLVADLRVDEYPNETALAFLPDETAVCLLRRDGMTEDGPADALVGTAAPPYRDWTWNPTGICIGGPELLILPDGRIAAAVRRYNETAHTMLCWLTPETGVLSEWLELPSGGDTSYPGMAWHDGQLWVSYYSTHEEKTAIYLARLPIP